MSEPVVHTADRRPSARRRWAVAGSAAVIVVVAVVVVVLVQRSGHGTSTAGPGASATQPPLNGSSTPGHVPTQSASSNGPLTGDAAAWADFPVDATPRPVVLTGQGIEDPRTGFRDGDSKEAYIEGRFTLATTLPDAPATRDGYEVSSAADAVRLLQTPQGKGPGTSMTLRITNVRLVERAFPTDRGEQTLPAWQVTIADVDYPSYVLAVAASERFDPVSGEGDGAMRVTLGTNGRNLTLPFVARHTSTGPCDAGFTQTLQVTQTANVVVLAVKTNVEEPSPTPSPVACALIGGIAQPDPGEPATRTVTLDDPLGARVVVNERGVPLAVTG